MYVAMFDTVVRLFSLVLLLLYTELSTCSLAAVTYGTYLTDGYS